MANHSPLPWAVNTMESCTIISDNPDADEVVGNTAGQSIDAAFFSMEPERAEANAELIVRAVNSHDALLSACKHALTCLSIINDTSPIANELRAVIAQAEGR